MNHLPTATARELLAELLGIFDYYDDESNLAGIYDDLKTNGNDVIDRVRAYLANSNVEARQSNVEARQSKSKDPIDEALLAIDVAVADDRISADVANIVRRALRALSYLLYP